MSRRGVFHCRGGKNERRQTNCVDRAVVGWRGSQANFNAKKILERSGDSFWRLRWMDHYLHCHTISGERNRAKTSLVARVACSACSACGLCSGGGGICGSITHARRSSEGSYCGWADNARQLLPGISSWMDLAAGQAACMVGAANCKTSLKRIACWKRKLTREKR